MNNLYGATWSVVLAAGDGKRLSKLTTTDKGETIPKQFCSLNSRECLLELALLRAARISPVEHVCTTVAAQHRRWWKETLGDRSPNSVIVQPQNRGTAVGTALSVLHVERQDPNAIVVLLPADHYVEDEATLAHGLVELCNAVKSDPAFVFLLGARWDFPDTELGYILPRGHTGRIRCVEQFVEKPALDEATRILDAGALCNMFILAGTVSGLLNMLERSYNFVAPMRVALNEPGDGGALSQLYDELPSVDFSRDVLAHFPDKLKVLTVPQCGWTDLGTPTRVAATVRGTAARNAARSRSGAVFLDLAKAVGSP